MKKYLKPIWGYIFLSFFFMAISYSAQALIPYFTQQLLERKFQLAILGYLVCSLTFLICNYVSMRLDWKYNIKFSTSLKNSWFNSLLSDAHHHFATSKVSEYISYQSNDLDALEKDYLAPLLSLFQQIMRMLIYIFVISRTINPMVALILLVTAVISLQIPKIMGKRTAKKRDRYLSSQGDYYSELDDLLSGHHLVTNRTKANFQKQQQQSLHELQKNYYGYGLTKALGIILNASAFQITGVILFVYLAYGLFKGTITVPEVAASLSYITSFSEPMTEILYDIQAIESVKNVKNTFLKKMEISGITKEPVTNFQSIHLKNIQKPLEKFALNIPDLTIHYGEKIALVGSNGSGKSSLLNILNGTDDDFSGEITIDDQPYHELDGKFAKIIQFEHVFKTTYEDNVTIFSSYPDKNPQKILSNSNPSDLSGGEKQRLYLNRVTNQDSPMLILDEPFSALDQTSLMSELKEVLKLKAAVIVTIHQNDEVLPLFDRVLEVSEGTLKEIFC